jgi:ferredoxin
MTESRFPAAPPRIAALPLDHRGFPVPWFVAWQDGKPVFPAMDGEKLIAAIRFGHCWVCGQPLGRHKVYVIGPMCIANRISSEPPSHLECARFAAQHCPFLANPRMGRVPKDKYGTVEPAGIMIQRNPGVSALATVEGQVRWHRDGDGILFDVVPISAIEWWAEGRAATRAEVERSFESGLPALEELAAQEGRAAMVALAKNADQARQLFPA